MMAIDLTMKATIKTKHTATAAKNNTNKLAVKVIAGIKRMATTKEETETSETDTTGRSEAGKTHAVLLIAANTTPETTRPWQQRQQKIPEASKTETTADAANELQYRHLTCEKQAEKKEAQ